MALVIENDEYLDAMNANFCGGVEYACNELEALIKDKKTTKKDIEKWLKKTHEEVSKTRKNLTVNKTKKVSVLH